MNSHSNIEKNTPPRVDLLLIADMVEDNSRVLDVGCGDGALLHLLTRKKKADGRGIEIEQARVAKCMAKGLSVIQGDAEKDLVEYPDNAFDYTILSQTIQATRNPDKMLQELLRVGKKAIVSFPNFGHWSVRLKLFSTGRMPVTSMFPYKWYETPNIHPCSIKDFRSLCEHVDARIIKSEVLNSYGRELKYGLPFYMQNAFGEQAVFLLENEH